MLIELDEYIKINYCKFLDYANFHAAKNNLDGMGGELLQFVFEIVLVDMDRQRVNQLLNTKYGNYNELHAYILGMIKINAFSPRSDFRRKILNKLPVDRSIDLRKIDIPCDTFDSEELDNGLKTLRRLELIREELDNLEVCDLWKDIFRWRFFHGNYISQWPGPEPKSKLYKSYNQTLDLVKQKVVKRKIGTLF